jgi:hypothetical protein
MKECCESETPIENMEAVDPLVSFVENAMGENESHNW